MTKRVAFLAVSILLTLVGTARLDAGAGKPSAARHAICGPMVASPPYADPPVIEIAKLPTDAGGQHELKLAVHQDDDRFCYRYQLNGVTQTVAPTIRVHRGESFDFRVINDIAGQSKGEFVSSKALPKCMPMAMDDAPVVHYVGYLNHTIDDRWMRKSALDANIHFHGFEGPADQENIFVSSLSTPMHA